MEMSYHRENPDIRGGGDQFGAYSSRVVSVQLGRSYRSYQGTCAAVLGFFQIFCGLWSMALGAASACFYYYSYPFGMVGYGIWCGFIFCLAGIMGIVSNSKRTPAVIITHMTFSIISAGFALLQMSLGVAQAYMDRINQNYDETAFNPFNLAARNMDYYPPHAGVVVVDALLAVAAAFEGLFAIAASAIACRITCCNLNFYAAQQEIDNPNVLSTDELRDPGKYAVTQTKRF